VLSSSSPKCRPPEASILHCVYVDSCCASDSNSMAPSCHSHPIWFTHRSRHCLPVRPGICSAIAAQHVSSPISVTRRRSVACSASVQRRILRLLSDPVSTVPSVPASCDIRGACAHVFRHELFAHDMQHMDSPTQTPLTTKCVFVVKVRRGAKPAPHHWPRRVGRAGHVGGPLRNVRRVL
jgi:hypothetical protein